jgi:hypothetical protein
MFPTRAYITAATQYYKVDSDGDTEMIDEWHAHTNTAMEIDDVVEAHEMAEIWEDDVPMDGEDNENDVEGRMIIDSDDAVMEVDKMDGHERMDIDDA